MHLSFAYKALMGPISSDLSRNKLVNNYLFSLGDSQAINQTLKRAAIRIAER